MWRRNYLLITVACNGNAEPHIMIRFIWGAYFYLELAFCVTPLQRATRHQMVDCRWKRFASFPPFLFGFCAHRAVVTMTSAVHFFFLFCGESSLQRARQAVSLVVSVSPRLKRMVETVLLDKKNINKRPAICQKLKKKTFSTFFYWSDAKYNKPVSINMPKETLIVEKENSHEKRIGDSSAFG